MTSADQIFKGSNKQMSGDFCRKKSRFLFLLLRIQNSIMTSSYMAIITILILITANSVQVQGYGYTEQKFAMEPQDQTAVVGSRVTLPCRVIGKSGVLQWTKDDFGLGAHRNLSGYERYSMIGSDEEGDFSLEIYPVQLDDDAKYQCQVSPGPLGQPGIRSRFATLTVMIPPEPPKIVQGTTLATTEDREVELECVSTGGKPAAEITWIDGEGSVLNGRAKYSAVPMADGRRFVARSVLKLIPKRTQHNSSVVCQAQNTADRTFRSTSIKLQVKYAPVVSVKIISGAASNGRIPEGTEVRFSCKAEANPADLTYKWFLNDEQVVGDYTTEMILFNVTRKLHDSIVKCEVHNAVGKSEESETLDVTYGPTFRSAPRDIQADLGSSVTLTCDLDGNPPPEIIWLHQDQDRWSVVGTTPNLTLVVDTSTAGKYNCKANVHGFPEIESYAMLYLKGPPNIVSHRTQLSIQGDNAKVECKAKAIPKPTSVTWYFNGREIDVHYDQDYTITEEPLEDGIKSILVIRESQQRHYGIYNCSVSNEYGTDISEILLMTQSSFPLIMILSGFAGGAVFILALTILLVLCMKKRRGSQDRVTKKPDVMADVDKASADRTSYISDLKLDLKNSDDRCNPEYSSQEFRTGLPLAGPVSLPNDRALLMQYSRYSNDYTDHSFPPNIEYKDGHNNNGYSGYIDYGREYNPPPISIQSSISALSPSAMLGGSHLSNQISGSLPRSGLPSLGHGPMSGSLQRNKLGLTADLLSNNHTGPRILPSNSASTLASGTYEANLIQSNGSLKHNGMLSPAMSNGIDIRYAATYGNPYLRTAAGLNSVNTANPAATPAPPPYNSIRNSMANIGSLGSNSQISPIAENQIGSSTNAQPQAPPQSPASQYILPPTSHSSMQMVQLTKKGTTTQPTLATHV